MNSLRRREGASKTETQSSGFCTGLVRYGGLCKDWRPCKNSFQNLTPCQGYSLGLSSGVAHGVNLPVCDQCNQKGEKGFHLGGPYRRKESPPQAKLCKSCSYTFMGDTSNQGQWCTCVADSGSLHLCHDCRHEYYTSYQAKVLKTATERLLSNYLDDYEPHRLPTPLSRYIILHPQVGYTWTSYFDCTLDIGSTEYSFDATIPTSLEGVFKCLHCLR